MNKTTIAHAAGIFDVKGSILCVTLTKRKYKYPQVRLSLCEKRWSVLEYLKKTFGGGLSNYDFSPEGYKRKYWTLTGSKVYKFLYLIEPYLKNENRQKQIKLIRMYDNRYINNIQLYQKLQKTYLIQSKG